MTVVVSVCLSTVYKYSPSRHVASLSQAIIVGTSGENAQPLKKIKEELAVACNDQKTVNVNTSAQMIMLKSQCDGSSLSKLKTIHLVNLSNGYEGRFFNVNKKHFKSEYIQLKPGENIIRVEARLIDGQKTEKILKIYQKSN